MRAADALRSAAAELADAGVDTPAVDAGWLLAEVLGTTRSQLALERDRELDGPERERFAELVTRRARREPLAYVLGEWGFRRLTLRVDRRVLVPRPETEAVVDRCLALLARVEQPEVLDVGTGSGAIALAIADEHPGARVSAFDNSAGALEVAAENAERAGLRDRVRLVERDLRAGLGGERFDLVVSNPPYVREDEIEHLEPEVRDWEPRGALVGDGVTHDVARRARRVLKPRGWLVLEVANGRAHEAAGELEELGYREVAVRRDLAGRERIVEGRR